MAKTVFREPNFRCRVSEKNEQNGKRSWRLCYAEDEAKAKAFLQGKGLIVHKVELHNFSEKWLEKTKEEAENAIGARQAGTKWEFKSIWRELKDHLLDLFSDKCAYCESSFGHVAYGDVEHYRPKARVTEDENHPGYYWLAYDPQNYLPCCQKCNQRAKKSHFPVKGQRAGGPGDSLEDEEPLLLNPYLEEYSAHLKFLPTASKVSPGWAVGITQVGETTIEVLMLNRQALVDARIEVQQNIRRDTKQAVATALFSPEEDYSGAVDRLRSEIESGGKQYSTAALCELNDCVDKIKSM